MPPSRPTCDFRFELQDNKTELSVPTPQLEVPNVQETPDKEILVDPGTGRRLEELCSEMTHTCGLIEAVLQLATSDESERRTTYMQTALRLSARGTRAIKMFLSEWNVLMADGRVLVPSETISVAEADRRAVMLALREAGGNIETASRLLGIGKTTLYRKLKEFNHSSQDHPS